MVRFNAVRVDCVKYRYILHDRFLHIQNYFSTDFFLFLLNIMSPTFIIRKLSSTVISETTTNKRILSKLTGPPTHAVSTWATLKRVSYFFAAPVPAALLEWFSIKSEEPHLSSFPTSHFFASVVHTLTFLSFAMGFRQDGLFLFSSNVLIHHMQFLTVLFSHSITTGESIDFETLNTLSLKFICEKQSCST